MGKLYAQARSRTLSYMVYYFRGSVLQSPHDDSKDLFNNLLTVRIIIIERCVHLPCALCYILFKYSETPQYIVCQEVPTNAFVGRQLCGGSAHHGQRGAAPEVCPPELSPPGWGVHLAHGTLVFTSAFCWRTSYLPERHVMSMQEEINRQQSWRAKTDRFLTSLTLSQKSLPLRQWLNQLQTSAAYSLA